MPELIREHRVQLGCGTVIVIALIVMFYAYVAPQLAP